MIDVNMLPRELTGYVGHVCGMWFACHFNDFEPVFVQSESGIVGELYEWLVDTVQSEPMGGGLDDEDAEEYARLAATVPWSMEEIDRVAFPHDWQRRMAESDHDRVSAYRMGLECVTKAYDKVFDRLGEAD